MKIHGDQTVDAGDAEQVGNELGADRYTGLVLAVLAGPTEVGDDGHDAVGRCTFGGINHQQELHKVVGVRERGLYEEYVASADGLLVADSEFAVSEVRDHQIAKGAAQTGTDFLGQIS